VCELIFIDLFFLLFFFVIIMIYKAHKVQKRKCCKTIDSQQRSMYSSQLHAVHKLSFTTFPTCPSILFFDIFFFVLMIMLCYSPANNKKINSFTPALKDK